LNRGSLSCNMIMISIGYLGSLLFLISTFLQRDALDSIQYRLRFVAAIVGLLYPSLGLYSCSSYRSVWSPESDYILSFAESFLFGAFLVVVASIYFSGILKAVPMIAVLSFLGINILAAFHSDLRESIPAVRAFSQVNGLVFGLAGSLILVRCWFGIKRREI